MVPANLGFQLKVSGEFLNEVMVKYLGKEQHALEPL